METINQPNPNNIDSLIAASQRGSLDWTLCWLIEYDYQLTNINIIYWTGDAWTNNVHLAKQFSSQKEAEDEINKYHLQGISNEHMFQ